METAVHLVSQRIWRLRSHEDGQTMAEYGLIMAAVFLVAIGAYQLLGPAIRLPMEATAGLFTSGT